MCVFVSGFYFKLLLKILGLQALEFQPGGEDVQGSTGAFSEETIERTEFHFGEMFQVWNAGHSEVYLQLSSGILERRLHSNVTFTKEEAIALQNLRKEARHKVQENQSRSMYFVHLKIFVECILSGTWILPWLEARRTGKRFSLDLSNARKIMGKHVFLVCKVIAMKMSNTIHSTENYQTLQNQVDGLYIYFYFFFFFKENMFFFAVGVLHAFALLNASFC